MNKRISSVIHQDLYIELLKICKSNGRSLNFIVNDLLTKAIKEKNRKRNVKKESDIKYHSSN